MVSTSSFSPIYGLLPRIRGWVWFPPSLASIFIFARGGVCTWGGGRGLCPGCSGGGGGEAHTTGFHITCFWEEGHKVQMVPMHYQHGQGKGPWNLLHVVSGPWTSFVAALDKGQWNIAACRRHSENSETFCLYSVLNNSFFIQNLNLLDKILSKFVALFVIGIEIFKFNIIT